LHEGESISRTESGACGNHGARSTAFDRSEKRRGDDRREGVAFMGDEGSDLLQRRHAGAKVLQLRLERERFPWYPRRELRIPMRMARTEAVMAAAAEIGRIQKRRA
jgi:hypothetical protein